MDDQTGVTAPRRRTRAEIEQIVAEFAGSGLNRTEFCRREAMSLGTLKRYLKRAGEHAAGVADGGLVAVELVGPKFVADANAGCGLAVLLARGRRIELEAGFDGPTLQRLVRLLEQM